MSSSMSSVINNQVEMIQRLVIPVGTGVATNTSPSLTPFSGALAYDNTTPGEIYVGDSTNWVSLGATGSSSVTPSNVVTLTNKTINSASNTLTITSGVLSNTNINNVLNQSVRTDSSPTFANLTVITLANLPSGTEITSAGGMLTLTSALGAIGTFTDLRANQTASRIVVLPDASTTLLGTDNTATITNKTINSGNNTLTISSASNANINSLIDQDVRTTASPQFATVTMSVGVSPSNPGSGIKIWSFDTSVPSSILRLNSWQGKVLGLDFTPLTASRIAQFPDASGSILLDSATQTVTNKTVNSASNTIQVSGTNINSLIDQDVRTTASPQFATVTMSVGASPSNPGSGIKIWSFDTTVPSSILRLNSWQGKVLGLDFTPLTASRIAQFPDASGSILLDSATQTVTNKTINSASNTIQVSGTNINSLVGQDVRNTASPTFVAVTLQTSGGTPTALNYYEEGTFSCTWTGAISASETIRFTRVGSSVTLKADSLSSAAGSATNIHGSGQLPTKLRPSGFGIFLSLGVLDNSANLAAAGSIFVGSNGDITIYKDFNNGNFTASGNAGHKGFSVSYCIN